jgi:hypothetical protein
LLTPADVGASYQIPKATLAKWRWKGVGPRYVKLGAKVLYRPEDLDAWISSCERGPDPANDA